MPLTPADVHNISFKRPAIGKRGYDSEEVDAFLDEVGQELIRLLEENNALNDRVQRGGGPSAGLGGPGGGPSNAAMGAELDEAVRRLEQAEETRAAAERNARALQAELARARGGGGAPGTALVRVEDDDRMARVLSMAQRTADDHVRDAHQDSEALLTEAQGEAERITGEARMAASSIEGDAQRKHAEAMDSLASRRAALIEEIERLGQLASGYQAALASHVARQMQELDSSGGE